MNVDTTYVMLALLIGGYILASLVAGIAGGIVASRRQWVLDLSRGISGAQMLGRLLVLLLCALYVVMGGIAALALIPILCC